MILQALAKLYDDLAKCGEISKPGWGATKVGFAVSVGVDGKLREIIPLETETERNGKKVAVNQTLVLPAPVKRSSGVAPNFLWDNSGYVFGVDGKGKPERSRECFEAFRKLHNKLLEEVDSDVAKGVLNFLNAWDPDACDENEVFVREKEVLLNGANIVFRVNGSYAHEDGMIAAAWQKHYDAAEGKTVQCLISGEEDILEEVHPSVKGVKDARSSGAAIVSFNAPAFCSYGHEQGANAPVGKKAAFAYTTALNHLLADRDNVHTVGDATVVCWADGGEKKYDAFSNACIFGGTPPNDMSGDDLRALVKRLAEGKPCGEGAAELDPETEFYILGLSPNAARISVRFFYRSTFGELMKNVNDHHERMEIIGSEHPYTPLWAMLKETVNQKSSDKTPSPVMAGAVADAIFRGTRYPASLIAQTEMRIVAEREITPGRAAIIKAYYSKNRDERCPEEVLKVSLNENSTNVPYALGRLFAVYEAAQEKANPGINVTIKDKFFNSAAATPSHIFPVLNDLYQKHLRKIDGGLKIYFDRLVADLSEIIGEEFPTRLSLPERGAFQLGYYHQKQKRYEKKENN